MTQLGLYDEDTGERVHGNITVVIPRRRNAFGNNWFAMAQNPVELIADKHSKTLGREGLTVLLKMMAALDFDNLIMICQAEIGRAIGMRPQHVQRALKKLIALDVLIEGPRSGIHRTYRLNPNFGWKGSAKSHHEALKQRMKAKGLSIAADNTGEQP